MQEIMSTFICQQTHKYKDDYYKSSEKRKGENNRRFHSRANVHLETSFFMVLHIIDRRMNIKKWETGQNIGNKHPYCNSKDRQHKLISGSLRGTLMGLNASTALRI